MFFSPQKWGISGFHRFFSVRQPEPLLLSWSFEPRAFLDFCLANFVQATCFLTVFAFCFVWFWFCLILLQCWVCSFDEHQHVLLCVWTNFNHSWSDCCHFWTIQFYMSLHNLALHPLCTYRGIIKPTCQYSFSNNKYGSTECLSIVSFLCEYEHIMTVTVTGCLGMSLRFTSGLWLFITYELIEQGPRGR